MSLKPHSQFNPPPPYFGLPNTRPRISSPLVSELTFKHEVDLDLELVDHPSPPSYLSTNTFLLVFFLIDSLTFVQLARFALPHLRLHLQLQLPFTPAPVQEFAQTMVHIPSNLIIPTFAMVKSISGICLSNTGTTWTSYSIRSAAVYTILAGLLSLPGPTRLASISILLMSLLAASVVICLPLLRLTQILLDLEDQQSIHSPHRNVMHPHHRSHRATKSQPLHRSSNLLQARYQHLMNPF